MKQFGPSNASGRWDGLNAEPGACCAVAQQRESDEVGAAGAGRREPEHMAAGRVTGRRYTRRP